MTSQHLYPPFIVGKYKGDYLKYYGQDFLMAAAGTRSGKGTSLVIPNLLTYPDSVVVEDIKEENYLYTSAIGGRAVTKPICGRRFRKTAARTRTTPSNTSSAARPTRAWAT